MLSSRQIVSMISTPPSGIGVGRARFAARQAHGGPASHAKFAADMANQPVPKTTSVVHPEDAVRGQERQHKALAPADLAWLDRLPRDPAQVPFPDATTVAAMFRGLTAAQPAGSSDRRLIDAVYAPIRAHHDRRVADAALTNARQPLPPVPSSALPALADAIAAEVPQLSDSEVMGRAGDMLRQALDQRGAARDKAIRAAQDKHLALAGDQLARTSPTHVA